jgi:hypothetical protein
VLVPKNCKTDADATAGNGADLKGYDSALAVYTIGTAGDSLSGSVKMLLALSESATDGSYTACAATDIKGTVQLIDADGEAGKTYVLAYLGKKRWILPWVDFTGTHTNGTNVGISVLRGHKQDVGN